MIIRNSLLSLFLASVISAPPQNTSEAARTNHQEFLAKLNAAAIERTNSKVRYDGSYVRIPYPGGDVPADTGVCTDEIIRIYRAVGIDLQRLVHEDMVHNFTAYPNQPRWGASRPDANIDHRRVPNLMVFFSRKGESLATTTNADDYTPGDLITWDLGGDIPHIGIVVDHRNASSKRYMYSSAGRSQGTTATSAHRINFAPYLSNKWFRRAHLA
jgi:uncharacterized protein YijF (DUF1287 family)